jgi:hypothetical protein
LATTIIKECNKHDEDEERVDVLTFFSAKIIFNTSSPFGQGHRKKAVAVPWQPWTVVAVQQPCRSNFENNDRFLCG